MNTKDSSDKKYYDIVRYAKSNVIWFYSAYNEYDNQQKDYLGEEISIISSFATASKNQGDLLLYSCYEKILCLSLEEIKSIEKKYLKRSVSQRVIAREFLRGKELYRACFDDIIKHHKSLQIMVEILKSNSK